jgi:hypothetical protein
VARSGAVPVFLAFAVLSASGSTAQSSSASPVSRASSGLRGHILFTRAGGPYGDETLFVAKANGTRQRRISKFGGACCPWATRDGSRIVVSHEARDGRVTALTARLNGTNQVVLPLPGGTLSLAAGPFSPDGRTLAREGFDDSHPAAAGIYLTRASDGATLSRVTQTHFIPGDFSPNGRQLLLSAAPLGSPRLPARSGSSTPTAPACGDSLPPK